MRRSKDGVVRLRNVPYKEDSSASVATPSAQSITARVLEQSGIKSVVTRLKRDASILRRASVEQHRKSLSPEAQQRQQRLAGPNRWTLSGYLGGVGRSLSRSLSRMSSRRSRRVESLVEPVEVDNTFTGGRLEVEAAPRRASNGRSSVGSLHEDVEAPGTPA